MGIHYDYKSTRGEKAMKKEAKRKARIEQRRAKKLKDSPYSGYESQFKNYQSGKKTIAPETTTNEQANNQIDMTTISGTGTMGDVDVAGKFDKNKAAILAGGSAKKRRIII